MRNLKRVLSLALALVMVLGMMVITTSAAKFTDAEEITYNEAVDVMSAIGVITGDNGNFYPNRVLTREEGAAFICYMLMGKDNADKLVGSGNFTDVKADRWSAGEIDYCNNLGIILGYTDANGKQVFNPKGELTAVAFGRMLLGALGYDGSIEGYTGPNWASSITADMIDAGLDVKGVAMDAQLTREQAAQMAFQALQATMVKYDDKGTDITIGDTSVKIDASAAEAIAQADTVYVDVYGGNKATTLQFSEKYFDKLHKNNAAFDDFGRPAHTWYYGAVENRETSVGKYVKNANYTVVVTNPKNDTLAEILEAKELELNPNTTDTNFKGTYTINGSKTTVAADDTAMTTVDGNISLENGNVVELFLNISGKVENIVVYDYQLAEVKKVAKAADDADYKYLITLEYAEGGTVSYKNTAFAGFDADKIAERDMIVVVKGASKVLSWAEADSVTGVMTAKGTGYIKVDGVEKKTSSEYSFSAGTDYTNTYTFYLDPNGYVMAADQETFARTSADFLYLADAEIYKEKSGTIVNTKDAFGVAKVVFMDGSEAVIDLTVKKWMGDSAMTTAQGAKAGEDIAKFDWYYVDTDGKCVELAAGTDGTEDSTASAAFPAGFYAYEIKDGKYILNNLTVINGDTNLKITATENKDANDTLVLSEGKAAVTGVGDFTAGTATSKTVLTITDKKSATTYTGIGAFENKTFTVGTGAGKVTAVLVVEGDMSGLINEIYVVGGTMAATDSNWAYLVDAGDITADGNYYNYYVGGEEKAYIVDGGSTAKGLHDIVLTDGEVTGAGAGSVAYGTIAYVDDTFIVLANGTTLYTNGATKVFNISGDFTGEEGTLAKDEVVAVGYKNMGGKNTIEVAYIIDAPAVRAVAADTTTNVGADDTLEFIQVGTEITISGGYAIGDLLFVTFDGTHWVEVGSATAIDTWTRDAVEYTTVGGTTDYTVGAGITLKFDAASAIGA